MFKSLELRIEKRLGEHNPVQVPSVTWHVPGLPSRTAFFQAVIDAYEKIELPAFPHRAFVSIRVGSSTEVIEAGEAVEDTHLVARDLWIRLAMLSCRLG